MSKEDRQPVITLAAVVATGLAAATAAIVTSKFGVAGTLIGAILTPMIISAGSAIYKVYIESASSKIRDLPGAVLMHTGRWKTGHAPEGVSPPERPDARNNLVGRFRRALGRFSSLPPSRRRSILIGALATGVASLLLGLGTVTGVELGAGKSLSCWIWNNCPAGSSAGDGETANTLTLPSIFGGGRSASSTPQAEDPDPRQRPVPKTQGSPSQPDIPGSETPEDSPASGQRWSPSGVPEDQQEDPGPGSFDDPEDPQPRSSFGDSQRNPSGDSEDPQRSSSDDSGDQQPTPSG